VEPDKNVVIDTFSEAVEEDDDDNDGTLRELDGGPVAASAIIASAVIGSVAAVFFISLFVLCKWRQYKQIRRNTRLPVPSGHFGRSRSRRQSARSSAYGRSPYYSTNHFWTVFGSRGRASASFQSVSALSGFSDSS
jgi:hypothetical protein